MSPLPSLRVLASGVVLVALFPSGIARAETWRVIPGVAVTETYSDNLDLSPADVAIRGWYTTVSPTLRVDLNGARAKGFLDYRYFDTRYSGQPQLNESQNFLNSRLTVEAIERWLYIDARADSSLQNRSPYGAAVTPDQPTLSQNRVTTNTIQLAPLIRGRFTNVGDYVVRYNAAYVKTDDTLVEDTKSGEFSARLQSANPGARFNWVVEASDLAMRNGVIDTRRDSRIRATIIYEVAQGVQVSASGGYEKSDFADPEGESDTTPGAGFTWTPSERTQVAAFAERRFFGTGHSLLAVHRTPQTAWRIASVKDAAVLPTGVTGGGAGSIGGLMSYLLTSAIPDPLAREAAVRRRLEDYGIGGTSILSSGVVNFRPYVFRNTTASAALLGVRHTLTLTYTDREERYSNPVISGALGQIDDTRQRGFSLDGSRRLTPLTTATVFGRSLRTEGLSASAPDTRQRDFGLAFSSRLGRYTTLTVGARRASFESTIPNAGYRENAVFLTLLLRT